MIAGLVPHDGHVALGFHLAKPEDNEIVAFDASGIVSTDILSGIRELQMMATGSRAHKPLIHFWASPSQNYSETDWANYWSEAEAEFDLIGMPYVEVRHLKFGKGGRSAGHCHRVYLRIGFDGKAISLSHSGARIEKVSRISEHLSGERFTSGCFNRSVIKHLRLGGRDDIAQALVRAGLEAQTARKSVTPAERAMTERKSDLATDEVWQRLARAWQHSDTGAAFKVALADYGLTLARGDKVPLVISPGGSKHPLLRALNQGLERNGISKIRKADLDLRLAQLILPAAENVRAHEDFDAGVFGIVGMAGQNQAHGNSAFYASVDEEAENSVSRQVTPAQEAALREFHDELVSKAAQETRKFMEEVAASARETAERRFENWYRSELLSAEQAGIGSIDWRARYRARLTGLPEELGARMRWVDAAQAERRIITLTGGSIIILEPDRVSCTTDLTHDAAAVMITVAKQENWSPVMIIGGVKDRERLARMAVNEGLEVGDEDLQIIVEEQKRANTFRPFVDEWLELRGRFAQMTGHHGDEQYFEQIKPILAQLRGARGLEHLVMSPSEFQLLMQDLERVVEWQKNRRLGTSSPRLR